MAGHEFNLTPELLLAGYAEGIFPMAQSREDDHLHWVDPTLRGVMPLDGFRLSRSLARRIRNAPWRVGINEAFGDVVLACADRDETWINAPLLRLYQALHHAGHAHSLELWQGNALVGGVFGVSFAGAFFGESMFSRERDASKVTLAYLVDRLTQGGFCLCDTQFLTPHLASLGGIEIPRAEYRRRLAVALSQSGDFTAPAIPDPQGMIQRITQTS